MNQEHVRLEIMKKINSPLHYMANRSTITPVITDMDHFPYTRYYRGVHTSDKPILFEREAGWRTVQPYCYQNIDKMPRGRIPTTCFQTSCTTNVPCVMGVDIPTKPLVQTINEDESRLKKVTSELENKLEPTRTNLGPEGKNTGGKNECVDC